MGNKVEKIGLFVGFSGVAVAVLSWLFPLQNSSTFILKNEFDNNVPSAFFDLSGDRLSSKHKEDQLVLNNIEVKKNNYKRAKLTISGMGTKSMVYLPRGQLLSIFVSGMGVDIEVDTSLMEFINIEDTGMGTVVQEM